MKNKPNNQKESEFIEKAEKVMLDYNQATGCSVCIYDKAYKPYTPDNVDNSPEKNICPFCVNNQGGEEPCHAMHVSAIEEANKKGSYHIYQCGLGFTFWTSPIYADGCFFGAVRGGGGLSTGQKAVDIFSNANNNFVMCNSEISKDEFKERINSSPKTDGEKVQSMAEMMQLCAESLSSGSEDYHEIIKRRAEQQEAISKIIEDLKNQYSENDEKPGYPLAKEKI
uniref:PocR domain-containing protein n=1 Tax=uncultured bacterium contig00160 TaxID=1181593 RepID=A0A806K210_9BACT|nr:hypothetical protein [uncultured bacterium contig00160]